MFAEAELTATEVERGIWYYQGINEVGNLYPDPSSAETMLGRDLSAFAEHAGDLREEYIIGTHTKSITHAYEQQSSNTPGPSSAPLAPIKRTCVKFRLNT